MNFISTQNPNEKVSFKTAVIQGLAKNKALFVPENIPSLPKEFFDTITQLSKEEIAESVLKPFIGEEINSFDLQQIIKETINFEIPVKHIKDNVYVLELFHGPTQAFKDVGARFMSRCLSYFIDDNQKVTILVATSGDTGSAVANGFFNVKGINVIILFPKGKVSAFQEFQMTSLGKNIKALEIDGTFDDCQALVKQAFSDEKLNEKYNLSSANSINLARLLPQMIYYFLAYQQIKKFSNKDIVVSVPSGNLGNITAGIVAKKMGLPIKRFVAAANDNRSFTDYLENGNYIPKASIQTFSNAMDVGNPSNFERLLHIYNNNKNKMNEDIHSYSYTNEETLEEMIKTFAEKKYILDPHGAVGKLALEKDLKMNEIGLFLETAHPNKFEDIVKKAIPDFPIPSVDLSNCTKISIGNKYEELVTNL